MVPNNLFQGSRHNIMESVIQFNFTILYLISWTLFKSIHYQGD